MSAGGWKVCRGPAHPKPTALPLDSAFWYFHGPSPWATRRRMVGKPLSRCRLCWQWPKLVNPEGPHGLVDARRVEQFAIELVGRCGTIVEVERRYGVPRDVLDSILHHWVATVKARTAARLIVALAEQRRRDQEARTSGRLGDVLARWDMRRGVPHCGECGGDLSPLRFTVGCETCSDRRHGLRRRRRARSGLPDSLPSGDLDSSTKDGSPGTEAAAPQTHDEEEDR